MGGQLRGPRLWREPGTQLSAPLPPGICSSPLPALSPRSQGRCPHEALLFPVLGVESSLAPYFSLSLPRTQAKVWGAPERHPVPCRRPAQVLVSGHVLDTVRPALTMTKSGPIWKNQPLVKFALQPWGAQTLWDRAGTINGRYLIAGLGSG